MTHTRRLQRRIQSVVILGVFLCLVYTASTLMGVRDADRLPAALANFPGRNPSKGEEKELVVASLASDDTKWLDDVFPDWVKNVYVVDDASAPLTVDKNKGREAMPFLT